MTGQTRRRRWQLVALFNPVSAAAPYHAPHRLGGFIRDRTASHFAAGPAPRAVALVVGSLFAAIARLGVGLGFAGGFRRAFRERIPGRIEGAAEREGFRAHEGCWALAGAALSGTGSTTVGVVGSRYPQAWRMGLFPVCSPSAG